MQGKDEGADNSEGDKGDSSSGKFSGGIAGRVSFTTLDIQILSWVGKRILVGLINKLIKAFWNIDFSHDLQSSVTGRKPLPVRPGMFLETVSKVHSFPFAINSKSGY